MIFHTGDWKNETYCTDIKPIFVSNRKRRLHYPKTAAAKIARARGQRFFVHICKRHGASEHYSSCMACVECQKQWYRDNGKSKPDPDIKPFSSAYTIAAVFFKGIRL